MEVHQVSKVDFCIDGDDPAVVQGQAWVGWEVVIMEPKGYQQSHPLGNWK